MVILVERMFVWLYPFNGYTSQSYMPCVGAMVIHKLCLLYHLAMLYCLPGYQCTYNVGWLYIPDKLIISQVWHGYISLHGSA